MLYINIVAHLPVNTKDSHNSDCSELITDIQHHDCATHETPEGPLSLSDKLVDGKRHHYQVKHVGYGQVQDVYVGDHFFLTASHRIDDQSIGDNPDRTNDPIYSWENVHEGCDFDGVVGPGASISACCQVGEFVLLEVRLGAVHFPLDTRKFKKCRV